MLTVRLHLQSHEERLLDAGSVELYPLLQSAVLGKPCLGDTDNVHAYTWKLSCSLAKLEIS